MKKIEKEGIDQEVMTNIFLPGARDAQTSVSAYRATLENNKYKNPKTQEKMNELVDTENGFGKHVAAMMREMGFEGVTSKLNNGDALEMKELLVLYILSGGKTTLRAMTPGERNLVILYLITVIGRVSPVAATTKSVESFLSGTDNKYMHEVVEIVGK